MYLSVNWDNLVPWAYQLCCLPSINDTKLSINFSIATYFLQRHLHVHSYYYYCSYNCWISMYSYTDTTHCKQFCVPISSRTLKSYKSLKCHSILFTLDLRGCHFQNILGYALRSPIAISYWHIMRVHILTNSHINVNNINDDTLGCASPS